MHHHSRGRTPTIRRSFQGPRISSADGSRFKALWKQRVLERMRAFSGDAMATMAHYLAVVMPEVWSELLAAHAVRA